MVLLSWAYKIIEFIGGEALKNLLFKPKADIVIPKYNQKNIKKGYSANKDGVRIHFNLHPYFLNNGNKKVTLDKVVVRIPKLKIEFTYEKKLTIDAGETKGLFITFSQDQLVLDCKKVPFELVAHFFGMKEKCFTGELDNELSNG